MKKNYVPRDYTKWHLPEGAKARLGKGKINDIHFSPDGILLGVACSIGIWLYDVHTGEELKLLTEHTGDVVSFEFSPDGSVIASSEEGDTIRLWDVATGTLLRTLTGHTDWLNSVVAFSPNGQMIASESSDNLNNTIGLWDVATGTLLRTLTGHTDWIYSIAFSPDGQTLASGSEDQTIRLWNVATGTPLKILTGHTLSVFSIAFNPDNGTLISGSKDNTIRLWDVATGALLKTFTGHTSSITSIAFSPAGQTLASGSLDRTIRLWDVPSGVVQQTLIRHTDRICSVCFSPDGSTLASGSNDKTICLWDIASGGLLKTLIGHTSWIKSGTFNQDGSMLISGGQDGTIRLWDTVRGEHLRTLVTRPDSDVVSNEHLKILNDHKFNVYYAGEVNSIVFSFNGNNFASTSSDGTILIWNLAIQNSKVILEKEKFDYYEYLKSDRWQKLRKSVLLRDNQLCICGAKATEVHHKTYKRLGNELPSDLVSLCRHCHQNVHDNHRIN